MSKQVRDPEKQEAQKTTAKSAGKKKGLTDKG